MGTTTGVVSEPRVGQGFQLSVRFVRTASGIISWNAYPVAGFGVTLLAGGAVEVERQFRYGSNHAPVVLEAEPHHQLSIQILGNLPARFIPAHSDDLILPVFIHPVGDLL